MAMTSSNNTIDNSVLENLVKCGICLDYYNDPRCLPCSHTFCYQCIEKLCEDGMGQCPMRDNSIFFRHTIDKLPVNRTAKDLVECINKSSSSEVKCDYCKLILSEFFCETCSKYSCTICLKVEHDINQFKTHQINIIIKQNLNHFCQDHLEEKLKYWCIICQQTVCSDCLLFKHKQHSFTSLEEISQQTKNQLHLSIQEMISMKQDLEKLNNKTTEAHRIHYRKHIQTKNDIEQTFNHLQRILEERKKDLINFITDQNSSQQKLIRQQKINIEENIKMILIREIFLKQILNIQDHFKLIQMKNDFISYNQLIQQQYQQVIQGYILHLQHFNPNDDLVNLQQQLQQLGSISAETFLTNQNNIQPVIQLSETQGEEKYQEFNGIYAYGYRFHLNKPLNINNIQIKVKLFNQNLIVYIVNQKDILIHKHIIKAYHQDLTSFKWITIPINYQIQKNYYIFISTQPDGESIPFIAYKESNHSLRKINEQISVRSKRAQIDKARNIDINNKFNVLYDALFNNQNQQESTILAIEMVLGI